uniref:Granulins domain-containing protein n=1 Tax=Wuchereria bancrofti TaxID=6293 RepID=A0AAF5RWT7_WUCBA
MILSIILFFAIVASDKALITHSCPGGKSVCPDSATCCLINEGIYGCCPMMDAVCCSDLIHCCPPTTKCDMVHRQCLQD